MFELSFARSAPSSFEGTETRAAPKLGTSAAIDHLPVVNGWGLFCDRLSVSSSFGLPPFFPPLCAQRGGLVSSGIPSAPFFFLITFAMSFFVQRFKPNRGVVVLRAALWVAVGSAESFSRAPSLAATPPLLDFARAHGAAVLGAASNWAKCWVRCSGNSVRTGLWAAIAPMLVRCSVALGIPRA